jgi:hypothetical protein
VGTSDRREERMRSSYPLLDLPSWRSLVTVNQTATDMTDECPVKALQVVPVLVDQLVKPCADNVFGYSSIEERTAIRVVSLGHVGKKVGPLVKGLADVAPPSVAGVVVTQHFGDPLYLQQCKHAWQSWVDVWLTMPGQQRLIHIPAWSKSLRRS